MSDNKKLNEVETENVTGGSEGVQNMPTLQKLIDSKGYEDRKCRICGKTFKYSRFLLYDWNGIDPDGLHDNDINTCQECKKEHPHESRVDWVKNK